MDPNEIVSPQANPDGSVTLRLLETRDLIKVSISRYQDEIVLPSNRGDPDVIFRDRSAFHAQRILDGTILLRRFCRTREH